MNPSTPPKGSLEDLFRHHLLESEAAAVPPRPQVWEQLDNSLLLAQNEHYRRRLRVHRWAIAASLLLASLAGGGWWHSQQPQSPSLATATGQATDRPDLAVARRAAPAVAAPAPMLAGTTARTSYSTLLTTPAIDQTATLRAAAQPTVAYAATEAGNGGRSSTSTRAATRHLGSGQMLAASQGRMHAASDGAGAWAHPVATTVPTSASRVAGAGSPTPLYAAQTAERTAGAGQQSDFLPSTAELVATAMGGNDVSSTGLAVQALSTSQASLAGAQTAALPASLSPVEVVMPAVEMTRPWQFGLSYAASAYQPNIDFTKAPTVYSAALGSNSVSITNMAAAEYRNNLRAGLGQRLGGWATRRLGSSRWRLRAGLELAQNTATSATSVSFLGEQVADLSYAQAMQAHLQKTSYRYRSVSAAAEMRYASPIKTGFSLYGRVGALFTSLLNVHSEVEGTPEATRTYTLLSTDSPYRHLTASLRGGAGIQYRPVGHQWSLNLGPVADFGILSLNADPTQDFWHQQRPYSFGLEAGLELGRPLKLQ